MKSMVARTLIAGFDITPDEFIRMDAEGCELINGEIRPEPMSGDLHAELCAVLCALLITIVGRKRIRMELDVLLSNRDVLRPDVCVLRSWPPKLRFGALAEPPLLCIEVVSPSQRSSELLAKCERYHEFGVPFCWVIDPEAQRAWEYHCGAKPAEKAAELAAGDVRLSLSELFEEEPRR